MASSRETFTVLLHDILGYELVPVLRYIQLKGFYGVKVFNDVVKKFQFLVDTYFPLHCVPYKT